MPLFVSSKMKEKSMFFSLKINYFQLWFLHGSDLQIFATETVDQIVLFKLEKHIRFDSLQTGVKQYEFRNFNILLLQIVHKTHLMY